MNLKKHIKTILKIIYRENLPKIPDLMNEGNIPKLIEKSNKQLLNLFKDLLNINNVVRIDVLFSTNKSSEIFEELKENIISGNIDFQRKYPFDFNQDNLWFYQVETENNEYYVIAHVDHWEGIYHVIIWYQKMENKIENIPVENNIYLKNDTNEIDNKDKKK